MPWYRQGTVAITAGQTTVTGTGTNFSANARVGDAFQGPDGRWYEVANIPSATVLSILPAYQGATVSGAAYALTPVQGYTKSLTDAVNAVVQQWGATLAGLGTVSTEDVVPVAKGGTGGTTPSSGRSGLGLGPAAVAAIVGAVSQSGGVPTGAIIENVVNANGRAIKFADGTMICISPDITLQAPTAAFGSLFISPTSTGWFFPAVFVGSAPVVSAVNVNSAQFIINGRATSNSVSEFVVIYPVSNSGGPTIRAVAIGRWF